MGLVIATVLASAFVGATFTALLMRQRSPAKPPPLRVGPRILRPPPPRVTRTRPMWGRPRATPEAARLATAPMLPMLPMPAAASAAIPIYVDADGSGRRAAELADMRTALGELSLEDNFEGIDTRLLIRV
jgi:hypothetical protein